MPGALPALERLGVHPRGFPLLGIDYRDGRRSARAPLRRRQRSRRSAHHPARRAPGAGGGARGAVRQGTRDEVAQDSTGVAAGGHPRRLAGRLRRAALDGRPSSRSGPARADGPAPLGAAAALPRRAVDRLRRGALDPARRALRDADRRRAGRPLAAARGRVRIRRRARRRAGARRAGARRGAGTALRGAGPFRQNTRARVAGRALLRETHPGTSTRSPAEGIRIGLDQARAAVAAIRAGDPGRLRGGVGASHPRLPPAHRRVVRLAMSPLRGAIVPISKAAPGIFEGAVERLAR